MNPLPEQVAAPVRQPARQHAPTRLAYVDQLRALAALYVAVFHSMLILWPEGGPRPPLYARWANYGHFGVSAFIVLSGFSLALQPALSGRTRVGSYRRFMTKRARRLLPPYWVALAGSVVLLALAPRDVTHGGPGGVGGEWTGKGPVPLRSVVSFFLLVHDFVRVPSPNSPLWSIAVEWHLYFLFPVLVWFGCRYGMRLLVPTCIVVGVVLHLALWRTPAAGTSPHFLALFAFGIAAAFAVGRLRAEGPAGGLPTRFQGWWLVVCAFGLFVVLSHWLVLADLVTGGVFAVGLYALAARAVRGNREPANGPATTVGTRTGRLLLAVGLMSYSLYLVHAPTEKVVWHFVVAPLGLAPLPAFFAIMVLGVGCSLVAAYVLFLLVEQPSMAWSRRVPR